MALSRRRPRNNRVRPVRSSPNGPITHYVDSSGTQFEVSVIQELLNNGGVSVDNSGGGGGYSGGGDSGGGGYSGGGDSGGGGGGGF